MSSSSSLELAGLPVSFASTKKMMKSSTEKNRKKKLMKKRAAKNKKKNQQQKKKMKENFDDEEDEEEDFHQYDDHFNYAEEFKLAQVFDEYREPFTILMDKESRFKCDEDEEEYMEDDKDSVEKSLIDSVVEDDKDSVENDKDYMGKSMEDDMENSLVDSVLSPSTKVKDPLQKYYHQRYDYFSLFDEGIQIDEEGWYSVTPEVIAAHIAQEALSIVLTGCEGEGRESTTVVLDAFCGVGGNTIQFAKCFDRVIAVDLDACRLEMARNNAQVYGVADRIQFIHGDVFNILSSLDEFTSAKIDLVFMSPPWGGPNYTCKPVFSPRRDLLDARGMELFHLGRSVSKNFIMFMPRQTDIYEMARMLKEETRNSNDDESFVVEQHWLRNKLKAISIYFYSNT